MENTMSMKKVIAWDLHKGSHEADLDLVKAALQGNLDAFNQLVILYQDRIFMLALRILGDEDGAEDITQDTFLSAFLSLPHFRNGSFGAWLHRIAINACYDELRRRKKHRLLAFEYEDGTEEKSFQFSNLSDDMPLPEKEVERLELEQVVQQALNRLYADQRAVVVLVDLEDFDYLESAKTLRVPIGTVKSRLARARLQLRDLLSEYK